MSQAALKLADYDLPAAELTPERVVTVKPEGGGSIQSPARRAELESAVDWSLWIEAREAAGLLSLDADHFMKKVRRHLSDRGMAMRAKGPDGSGQLRWWIKRDYDLKLHGGSVGTAHRIPDAFYKLTAKQQNQAMARAACVARYRSMLTDSATGPKSRWIDGLVISLRQDHKNIKVARRTLERWHSVYDNPSDMMKLVDRRGGARGGEIDPAAWQFFHDLYLGSQLNKKYCHQLTCDKAEAEGWRWHSRGQAGYTKTLRMLDARVPLIAQVKARDPERYRNTMSPHMVMDPDAFAPGERWQGDHCVLDLFCLFPGTGGGKIARPWLTAWMDTKSRKIVGWELCEAPSSETIRAALAKGMRDPSNMGGPPIVHIDNGKDYKCEALVGTRFTKKKTLLKKGYADAPEIKGLYGLLGIETIFAIPKNSRGKGAIESWFGYSLHERFDKLWTDIYAGNKPANRPPGLAERLRKMKGDGTLPTFEDIRQNLALHIDQYNADVEHGKQDIMGRSPNAIMLTAQERVMADPGVLDFLSLTITAPRRVTRQAVSIPHQGTTLRYASTNSAFLALSNTGKMVRVGYRQEDLFAPVVIFDAETMQPICTATNQRAGTSTLTKAGRENIKSATAIQRKVERAHETIAKHGQDAMLPREILALKESLRKKRAIEEMADDEANRGGKRLVQTPLDGQSKRLKALQIKRAVGAEPDEASDDFLVERARLNARVREASKATAAAATVDNTDEETIVINMADAAAKAIAKANGGGK